MIKNILPGGNQSTSFPSRITNNQGIELMDKKEIANRQVTDFLDENHLLSNSQSGFRNSHSTDTAVTCVSDYILSELSEGKHVGAVLIYLKKAFDTVDHQILLKKLFCYRFRDMSFG